jgi:hypothetical protein
MKFAAIVPVPMLDLTYHFDYHMVLAPQLARREYSTFYSNANGHVILDNGIAEGAIPTNEELLLRAIRICANEVIAPDVMYDAAQTIQQLGPFCEQARVADVRVMAVLQATNWVEFEDVLDVALSWDVAAVAMPKLLTDTLSPNARIIGAELIRSKSDIPIHCLGSSADIKVETKALAAQDIVRGIDTAAPAVMGLLGQSMLTSSYDWRKSHGAVIDYWNQPSNGQVEANIELFHDWCRV